MEKSFPVIASLDDDVNKKIKKRFLGYTQGLVKVGEIGHVAPPKYAELFMDYYNFPFQEDDVLIMTFPKCGTTWTQEIVWFMRNNLDEETATTQDLYKRSPFIDFDFLIPDTLSYPKEVLEDYLSRHPEHTKANARVSIDTALNVPAPRTIKTHLPMSLFKPGLIDRCKIIYVARNPKDACVSYFYHNRLVRASEFQGDLAEFVDYWSQDLMLQSPYWEHVYEAWELRDHPNMHFMFFEDMKKDIMKELKALDKFIGTNLSEDQLEKVRDFTSFASMKAREQKAVELKLPEFIPGMFKQGEGSFIRKGKSGGWKDEFTPEIQQKFDAWIKNHQNISSKIPFKYSN